ncbi:hypothetical protein [Magnetospirillum aberrantis]|uniref:Lipoprotein n=1 Tax=Magnetospirillum aberrantis SpK TaxID=908842 RepID=A0A7C9UV91_9PROT|nr:hypothetical protein [Magnetospirillum aberrantis]NFV81447.1 hypothetical protein [Magnetospirillum aberrantis SpK]
MRLGLMVAVMAALALGGCLGPDLNRENMTLSAPSGVTLPIKGGAMVYMAQRDLDRPLVIEATRFRNEETTTKDGRTLERAAHAILGQAFTRVETNNPAMQPQLVLKVVGVPKFSRLDNVMKIGCSIDTYLPDGAFLGSFLGRFDSKDGVDYKDALEPAYKLCLKSAADQMLASPALQRAAKSGFATPHPAAYRSFMESLGFRL